jgi:hypothetical protein
MALPVNFGANFGANSQEMADFAKVLAKVQAKVLGIPRVWDRLYIPILAINAAAAGLGRST